MYLKNLSISGFKSFAKKGELVFETPITGIVGPNGSGKSNVAEAFRFVLGEQSVKSMRGKKGEDLIFNGSDSVARGNKAAVTITLDNQKRVFPMDYDEIIIDRVVHRDGQNEYMINGAKVRLKDVQEILAAANIGPTGHHIISQGEADRILSANPRERREMIEDALGLKVFQFKKQEAERKLKKTEDNMAQVESLRRENAPHLKYLERQVKKIEKAVSLRESLTTNYQEYLKREVVYLEGRKGALAGARSAPVTRLDTLETELATAKTTLAAAEKDDKRDALITLEEKVSVIRRQRQDVLRDGGKLEGQISFLERRIKDVHERAQNTEHPPVAYLKVRDLVTSLQNSIERSKNETDTSLLQRTLADINHVFNRFLEDIQSHIAAPDTASDEAELVELKKQKNTIDAQSEELAVAETELSTEYETLKTSIESEANESRQAEREVFRIMNERRDVESAIAEIDRNLQALERDREEYEREVREAIVLIGAPAGAHREYAVMVDGVAVSPESMMVESRTEQQNRRRELEKMKIRLEELGAGAADEVLKEYQTVKERDEFLTQELSDLAASIEKLTSLITDLTTQLDEQLVAGIHKIDAEFNRFFTLMFGGGVAKLIQVEPKVSKKTVDENGVKIEVDDEEEVQKGQAGIDLDVKLPNKRVRGLSMLSGGERALTSIALIFAMSQVNPPLFVILDETDAALDEANSRRYGDMIEALAQKSQLILITHNRETMSRAGVLYGVTMRGDGASQLLSVKFDEAAAHAKA